MTEEPPVTEAPKQKTQQKKSAAEGVFIRHGRRCATHETETARCTCKPTYLAHVWSKRDGKRIYKTFPTVQAAKQWRSEAQVGLRKGTMKAPSTTTVREAADALVQGMKDGTIRNKQSHPFKPKVIRDYESALRRKILPHFGGARLTDVRRVDVQDFADRLLAEGLDPQTVRNILLPLRVIFRRAMSRQDLAVNPTRELELPTSNGRRERVATAEEVRVLLHALPENERAVWATAFYAGLRLGELQALRWEHVDLAGGVLSVMASWDPMEGEVAPKYAKSVRRVPLVPLLRDYLAEHKARTGRDGRDFVFGRTAAAPFAPATLHKRSREAWAAAAVGAFLTGKRLAVELSPITPHEARHSFVSLMFDAGFSLERIGDYAGHTSAYMTDRYRHLLDGHEEAAARQFAEYLDRADTAARIAQVQS